MITKYMTTRTRPSPAQERTAPQFMEPMKPLSLKFTDQTLKRLMKARRLTGRRQTELIRNAVDAYLDSLGI